jgi:broad specificity phosphatase PhoE
MRRTVQTARHISHQRLEGPGGVEWINMRPKAFKNLDEIYAGVCDGMMYEEVAQTYPEEVSG